MSNINKMVDSLDSIYYKHTEAINKLFHTARRKDTYYSVKDQSLLKKHIKKKLDALKKEYKVRLYKGIRDLSTQASLSAYTTLKPKTKVNKQAIKKGISKYAKAYLTNQQKYITAQVNKMSLDYKRTIDNDNMKIRNRSMVDNISKRQSMQVLKNDLIASEVDTSFRDKLHRKWKTNVYFNMFAKTILSNVYNEVYMSIMVAHNQDLVRISSHNATDACRPHEGEVISLTGATKGYPTYYELKASKEIFHPRCKHYLIAI